MSNDSIAGERSSHEERVMGQFLESPNEVSFADLFRVFTPQLVAFFRARGCETAMAEDLAQDVMLTVYLKVSQVRERTLFRAWLFKIARNVLSRQYRKRARDVATVDLADVAYRVATTYRPAASPGFEFERWIACLDSREQELMRLRFIEQWEYHEIASAHGIPIGTVLWKVFNAQKKLAPHLRTRLSDYRQAA
jgi:RNA polymerase sigma-70 factor, ECF subfamily